MTGNVADFERLAASSEVHPGIVLLLDGGLLRLDQELVVRRAIPILDAELEGRGLLNRVLRISLAGGWSLVDLPASPGG